MAMAGQEMKKTGGARAGPASQTRPLVLALGAVFLLLLFLSPLLQAAPSPDLSDFALGLPATVFVPGSSLNASPTRLTVWAMVKNTGERDWIVYLLSQNGSTWKNERVLGVIQPGQTENLSVDFEARYDGRAREVHEYAIVATGNAVPLGQYFTVIEDWKAYQDMTNAQLHDTALLFVPTAAGIIVILLILLAEWGYSSKAPGEYRGEYTVRSLFLPRLWGAPLGQELADLMAHPAVWAIELLAVLAMAALVGSGGDGPDWMWRLLFTGLGSLALPLVYFSLIWFYNEQVERMPLRFFTGAFFWGALAAVLSLVAVTFYGPVLKSAFGLDDTMLLLVITALSAPLVEEFLKGLGLLAMAGHHEVSDALHGMLLGLSVGLGFSFVENWIYLAVKTDPLRMGLIAWAGLAFYRTFFNSISHACFTAALGGGLGWAKSQNWGRLVVLAFVPALAVAGVLHALFNITAILDGFSALQAEFPVYIFNPTLVVVLMGLTAISLAQAVSDHRRRVARAAHQKAHEMDVADEMKR